MDPDHGLRRDRRAPCGDAGAGDPRRSRAPRGAGAVQVVLGDATRQRGPLATPEQVGAVIDLRESAFYIGDCRKMLRKLPAGCVQMCVTSQPYWGLRSYLDDGDPMKEFEIGTEDTPEEYVKHLVEVFAQVWRVLADDGTLWLNLGDSYAGSRSGPQGETGEMANRAVSKHRGMVARTKGVDPKNPRVGARDNNAPNRRRQHGLKNKDLIGLPWRVAFALRDYGWYLRADNIWAKPNPMPESVT